VSFTDDFLISLFFYLLPAPGDLKITASLAEERILNLQVMVKMHIF